MLVVAALVWGLLFSSRATGRRLRPNWWLDLHNWLGGLSLAFVGVHIAVSWLDRNAGVGVVQLLVPGTAAGQRWAIGLGVVAAYTFVLTVLTSWPRRVGNRRIWRMLHLTSVAGVALAFLHTLQSGSDSGTVALRALLVALVAVAVYMVVLRVFGLVERARESR